MSWANGRIWHSCWAFSPSSPFAIFNSLIGANSERWQWQLIQIFWGHSLLCLCKKKIFFMHLLKVLYNSKSQNRWKLFFLFLSGPLVSKREPRFLSIKEKKSQQCSVSKSVLCLRLCFFSFEWETLSHPPTAASCSWLTWVDLTISWPCGLLFPRYLITVLLSSWLR